MTVYEIKGFNHLNYEDYIHNCSQETSKEAALAECALWNAYRIQCGNLEDGREYCKRSICEWPLDKRQFDTKYFGGYYQKKYRSFENYKSSEDYVVKYVPDDDSGWCQLHSLLDNFDSYHGVFRWGNYLVILSVGSSYTGLNSERRYDLDHLTEGFAVVIDVALNTISLFSLGEDDGNYWIEKLVPYKSLCIYDRGIVTSIVNDIDSSKFWNKDRLIYKLINNLIMYPRPGDHIMFINKYGGTSEAWILHRFLFFFFKIVTYKSQEYITIPIWKIESIMGRNTIGRGL